MLSNQDNTKIGPVTGLRKGGATARHCLARLGLLLALFPWALAQADTEITAVGFESEGGGAVTIRLATEGGMPEVSVFETDSPARIVLDLAETSSRVDSAPVSVGEGAVRSFTTLEAGGRTRVMVDLSHSAPYDYRAESGEVRLTVAGSAGSATTAPNSASYPGRHAVQRVDFRRGDEGQSRVVVSLDSEGASFTADAGIGRLTVDVYDAALPDHLNQVLDVVDFATPVQSIDVSPSGQGVRLELAVAGSFEHLAYQSGSDVVIEVAQKTAPKADEDLYIMPLYEDKTYSGTKVTFNFQDIPVRSVLQLIADVSNLNIVVSDAVGGNLTLRLTNVPWDQALDIILDARNLDKRQNGNVIWIAPAADIAAREQQLLQAIKDRKELEPLQTALISVSYATAEDLRTLIEESSTDDFGEEGLLSERGSVTIDARTNTLLVTDTADRIEEIQALVLELDRPVKQVQIESRIVVASSDFSHELGVRFGLTALHDGSNILAIAGDGAGADLVNPRTEPFPDPGEIFVPSIPQRYNVNLPSGSSNAATIGLSFLSGDYLLDLELSALEAEGEGEVISTPRIVTANQAEAFIQQGVEIPYQEATSSGATNVSYKEAVLELRATPLITPDNRIQLDLEVKQDSVGEIFIGIGGSEIPSIDTRELNTSVLVNNGETIVLGGIFQDERSRSEDRVPYLSSIPGIGNLFKRRANQTKKRELLIFVTPSIVEERPVVN